MGVTSCGKGRRPVRWNSNTLLEETKSVFSEGFPLVGNQLQWKRRSEVCQLLVYGSARWEE